MRPFDRRHQGCGFTLVELTAVIALVALLLAILLPAVGKSMRMASSAVCMHNLQQVNQALHTYRLDNDGWLPSFDRRQGGLGSGDETWFTALVPKYIPDPTILRCPADPGQGLIDPGQMLSQHPDPSNASSYGLNDLISVAGLGNLDRNMPKRPAETMLVADLGPDAALAGPVTTRMRSGGRLAWDDRYDPGSSGLTRSWLTGRHMGHINVLTVGGAVTQVPTELQMQESIKNYYGAGAAGGCPLCLENRTAHYSFATSRVFWWTGSLASRD